MEGVVDEILRDVLTGVGGIDWCVTEFIRVNDSLLPEHVFRRFAPELAHGAKTPAGTEMRVQLLGSNPEMLAENAVRACTLGAPVIDLNFGCPANVVNRHGGGAALLDEPELLTRIVTAVRRAVPASMPVSAKMRLGVRDDSRAEECALALQDGLSQQDTSYNTFAAPRGTHDLNMTFLPFANRDVDRLLGFIQTKKNSF